MTPVLARKAAARSRERRAAVLAEPVPGIPGAGAVPVRARGTAFPLPAARAYRGRGL